MRLRGFIGRLLVLTVSGLAAIVLIGCAPNADDQQIQSDQFALRGMIANNQQQIDSLQTNIQRLQDRVSELEHNGAASGGGGNGLASIEQRLDKLESQVNSAPAGAAGPAPAAGATPEGSAAPEAAPGSEGGEEAPAAGPTPTSPNPGAAAAPPNAGSAAEANAEAPAPSNAGVAASAPSWRAMLDQELSTTHDDPGEKLYRAGLVELKANNYSQALNQLQTLQHRYPKSSLSEPAEFFAANALYEMGNYDQAILQFNDQTMRFPKSRFASAALLREAQAFMKINDRIDARLTLQKLLSDLPDSAEAPMAKSMMQTLAS
jgi:TolA-binding protein